MDAAAVVLSFDGAECIGGLAGSAIPICQSTLRLSVRQRQAPAHPSLSRRLTRWLLHELGVGIRGRHVCIVWSAGVWSTSFEREFCESMHELGVSKLSFVTSASAALYPLGIRTALVLQTTRTESAVLPVVDGYLLHSGVHHTNFSLQLVVASLRAANGLDALTDEDLEEFITRFGMFKTSADDRRSEQQFIELKGHRIARTAVEGAFESLFGENEEGQSLADVIVESLSKVPRDVRAQLVSRLLPCGPLAALPSFPARLVADIKRLLLTPRYNHLQGISQLLRVVDCIVPPGLLLWIGGSIACAAGAPQFSLEREAMLDPRLDLEMSLRNNN